MKVPDVTCIRLGVSTKGTLHLTTHHFIFREAETKREIWICYPMIAHVERRHFSAASTTIATSSLRIRCKDFTFLSLNFISDQNCKDAFDSMLKLTCVPSITKLYAYMYKPGSLEKQQTNGWSFYDPLAEFERMGTFTESKSWRTTNINADYSFSPTYPAFLVVPSQISDNVLNYGSKYRSKLRIPALSYYHKFNGCSITRCSQPMVGLKQSRSAQDEKIVSAIFASTQTPGIIGATSQENLIVDARPTTNAMAQTALGAGSENMENYKGARKVYLGIDNIHVMRESLNKINEALRDGDISSLPPNRDILLRSNWLRYLSIILDGAVLVARQVHFNFAHVMIHCSDGWDRTSQLSSLAQIFLDPYYRTLDGFIVLVEKEWLSFGHRFGERCGHLNSEKHFVQKSGSENNQGVSEVFSNVSSRLVKQSHVKYTSPVFHQFLDCVYQLIRQFPDRFEYNERFLRRLLYHTYSCQYGTFLYNNEHERKQAHVETRTRSVWDYFLARREQFIVSSDSDYDMKREAGLSEAEGRVLLPDTQQLKWWPELFGRTEKEMNRVERKHFEPKASGSSKVASPVTATTPVAVSSPVTSTPLSAPASDPIKLSSTTINLETPPRNMSTYTGLDDNPYSTSLQDSGLIKPAAPSFPSTHIQPLANTSTIYTNDDDDDNYDYDINIHDDDNDNTTNNNDEVNDSNKEIRKSYSNDDDHELHKPTSKPELLDPKVYASFNAMTMDSEPTSSGSISTRRFF